MKMAVIHKGGANPLQVQSWLDWIKLFLLEYVLEQPKEVDAMKRQIAFSIDEECWLGDRLKGLLEIIMSGGVEAAIKEMYRDGWIEPDAFHCNYCKERHQKGGFSSPEEAFVHIVAFKITEKGRDLLPEVVFP